MFQYDLSMIFKATFLYLPESNDKSEVFVFKFYKKNF